MKELVLSLAPSIDVFLAAFALGVDKIKFGKSSVLIIAVISTAALIIPLLFSSIVPKSSITLAIGVIILTAVGLSNIFKSYIKSKLKSNNKLNFSKFGFVFEVYIDEKKADRDFSKVLNAPEAITLAVAVAIDAFATGLGAGFATSINIPLLCITSLIIVTLSVIVGEKVGKQTSKLSRDYSWLGGVVLIGLAISRII